MKKNEKTELTKNKIIAAAIIEFGTNSYKRATLNHICAAGIPKGLLYHNYKNKEEIYMECVKKSFADLLMELNRLEENGSLKSYLNARLRFIKEKPYESNIIFEILIEDDSHHGDEIKKIKKELEDFNIKYFKHILEHITLRKGVSKKKAEDYFSFMQSAFNVYFAGEDFGVSSASERTKKHEEVLSEFLDMMLYGIVERGEK